MSCVVIISYNSWYACSIIDICNEAAIDKICILTDHSTKLSIEGVLKYHKLNVDVMFFFELKSICKYIKTKTNIVFITDHPYRQPENYLIKTSVNPINIITMSHGLSVPKGWWKYKKLITNCIRGFIFNIHTRRHNVKKLKGTQLSGMVYLNWFMKFVEQTEINYSGTARYLVFATSGAGRYNDRNFKLDTKLAFQRAKKKAVDDGLEFCVLGKNREDLSYLGNEIVNIKIFSGGLLYVLTNLSNAIKVVCYDQSTLLYEAKCLGLDVWTYHARFKKMITYIPNAKRTLEPAILTSMGEQDWSALDSSKLKETANIIHDKLKEIHRK